MSGSLARGPAPWPHVTLQHGLVSLRAITLSDAAAWRETRQRNVQWLSRWEATRPPGDGTGTVSFRSMVRELRRQARQGRSLPLAIVIEGRFAGQVTLSNITGGSARFASIGYWIDQRHAGHGYTPVAVALVIDYAFAHLDLHRVEIAVRPENTASLRVVEKLAVAEIGYAPRYLHIDGGWRDHRLFAVTTEEVPEGLLARLLATGGAQTERAD